MGEDEEIIPTREGTQHQKGGIAKLSGPPGPAPSVYYSQVAARLGGPCMSEHRLLLPQTLWNRS